MLKKIETVINDLIRPALAQHGGDITIIDLDNGKLFVKMEGGCHGCSQVRTTVKDGIERLLVTRFPEFVEEVVDLTDHATGENPYM